ncbi:MAG: hypothetical protein CL947_00600 [Epsilonproteobacteria bacterium]|nr:hypothetical protein [Campylobacterota bacterium]|tara:strand:+ start:363 stop:770 length:408 start_codon:yes stop_codon:yes gene_type:complete
MKKIIIIFCFLLQFTLSMYASMQQPKSGDCGIFRERKGRFVKWKAITDKEIAYDADDEASLEKKDRVIHARLVDKNAIECTYTSGLKKMIPNNLHWGKKNLFKEKQHVPVVNTVNMMSSEEAQTIIALLLATKKV